MYISNFYIYFVWLHQYVDIDSLMFLNVLLVLEFLNQLAYLLSWVLSFMLLLNTMSFEFFKLIAWESCQPKWIIILYISKLLCARQVNVVEFPTFQWFGNVHHLHPIVLTLCFEIKKFISILMNFLITNDFVVLWHFIQIFELWINNDELILYLK